jgi:predicted nuclease of predicted toxin-antitoxin system
MKLLFDQNISYRILKRLPEAYSGSSHVKKAGLINSSDLEIWEYAKTHEFILVTQDSDFNDIYLLKGFPPKILWLQAGNIRTNELADLLSNQQIALREFQENEDLGCLNITQSGIK